ncbi:conjugal transfer protein TraI [Chitinophaga tropicalis]|uniref:Conjugal transfer protein TraI n=1 Tax=Chitinophaga tropicalis TaxID=2683588 RepID=A0A7K1U001_9BACT|nr:conjugal transfer protein TraI [Chitinophaga tropicalis]MVT07701.1 conjugal transfer protein TraI [Chitinophaga tropicalis]
MKLRTIVAGLVLVGCLTIYPNTTQAAIPIAQIIKEAIVKVIKAVDLMIQRLQNVTIKLQSAQKALENAMSKLKLDEISQWAERQRDLYQKYYDELWRVKTAIAYYQRIKEIIARQGRVVDEYKNAMAIFKQDKNFSRQELDFMYQVYSGILSESVKNLDEVMMVISSFATQMSDAERLALIQQAADNIDRNLSALRSFNDHNVRLSLSRAKGIHEVEMIKKLYGLP